jgi:hypothetical protein
MFDYSAYDMSEISFQNFPVSSFQTNRAVILAEESAETIEFVSSPYLQEVSYGDLKATVESDFIASCCPTKPFSLIDNYCYCNRSDFQFLKQELDHILMNMKNFDFSYDHVDCMVSFTIENTICFILRFLKRFY